jgi:hypothetical protein
MDVSKLKLNDLSPQLVFTAMIAQGIIAGSTLNLLLCLAKSLDGWLTVKGKR